MKKSFSLTPETYSLLTELYGYCHMNGQRVTYSQLIEEGCLLLVAKKHIEYKSQQKTKKNTAKKKSSFFNFWD